MSNQSSQDRKEIDEHVNRLVNASVLRMLQKMAGEFKEEERINRAVLRWLAISLVAICLAAAAYVFFTGTRHAGSPQSKSIALRISPLK